MLLKLKNEINKNVSKGIFAIKIWHLPLGIFFIVINISNFKEGLNCFIEYR